jgi:hypothetical protein
MWYSMQQASRPTKQHVKQKNDKGKCNEAKGTSSLPSAPPMLRCCQKFKAMRTPFLQADKNCAVSIARFARILRPLIRRICSV